MKFLVTFLFVCTIPHCFAGIQARSIDEQRLNGCMWGGVNVHDSRSSRKPETVKKLELRCRTEISKVKINPNDPPAYFSYGCVQGVAVSYMDLVEQKIVPDNKESMAQIKKDIYNFCMGGDAWNKKQPRT